MPCAPTLTRLPWRATMHAPMRREERFRGCLLGLACGDAVGAAVEFCPRGSFEPVMDMMGGGPFNLQPGEWTDDTSMALCLASSLVECRGFDARDQMERYCRWRREGYWSSTGRCFDIGNTTSAALGRFELTGNPWAGRPDPYPASNGCIMRLAPVPMFFHADLAKAVRMAGESSRTTHGAPECIDACRLFAAMLVLALKGESKEVILTGHGLSGLASPALEQIATGGYRAKPESEICGSGYVVESLEAALWSLHHTNSFEAAMLAATNLGDDTDTTAAVCGQLAGAFYGESGIPRRWLDRIVMADQIRALAEKLCQGQPPHLAATAQADS